MIQKPLLYIVDDEPSTLTALERLLRNDLEIRLFSNPELALQKIETEDPALVLTDYTMPQMSGFEFLRKVRALKPSSVRAVISGFVDSGELSAAINSKLIHRFFIKPWENDVLKLQVMECLSQRNTLLERDQLAALALTDPVTGLGNHRLFQDQLATEVERARRHQRDLSLIMIDVDYFKPWNDQFGHPAGDRLLQDVAKILLNGVRNVDLVARYGGDEFAVILPDTKVADAFDVSERLRKNFELSFMAKGPTQPTLSLGVASFPTHAETPKNLVQAADQALYESKKQGRNQSKIADSIRPPLK